jgi:hypothetical protein
MGLGIPQRELAPAPQRQGRHPGQPERAERGERNNNRK